MYDLIEHHSVDLYNTYTNYPIEYSSVDVSSWHMFMNILTIKCAQYIFQL